MADGHGGVRAGAGRPKVQLIDLVRSGSFSARNPRHRRALYEDEIRLGRSSLGIGRSYLAEELLRAQKTFRASHAMGDRSGTSWAGQRFEQIVASMGGRR